MRIIPNRNKNRTKPEARSARRVSRNPGKVTCVPCWPPHATNVRAVLCNISSPAHRDHFASTREPPLYTLAACGRRFMVDETPTDGGAEQRRQLENEAALKRAWSKVSSHGGEFGAKLSQSLDVVRRALDDFGGGGETGNGLAISFNGGKDACVVLYLLLFVLAERGELRRLHSSTTGRKVRQDSSIRCLSPSFLRRPAHRWKKGAVPHLLCPAMQLSRGSCDGWGAHQTCQLFCLIETSAGGPASPCCHCRR